MDEYAMWLAAESFSDGDPDVRTSKALALMNLHLYGDAMGVLEPLSARADAKIEHLYAGSRAHVWLEPFPDAGDRSRRMLRIDPRNVHARASRDEVDRRVNQTSATGDAPSASASAMREITGRVVRAPVAGEAWFAPPAFERGQRLVGSPYPRHEMDRLSDAGDRVERGETVAVIWVMGEAASVTTEAAGVVKWRLVDDGDSVSFGQPLVEFE